jgi:HxlR-like helix-turn-helix
LENGGLFSLFVTPTGTRRFSDFQKSLGLAKNVLGTRVKKLVACGVMEQVAASDGSAQEYALTQKGRELFPVVVALRQWEKVISFPAARNVFRFWTNGPKNLSECKYTTRKAKSLIRTVWNSLLLQDEQRADNSQRSSLVLGQRKQGHQGMMHRGSFSKPMDGVCRWFLGLHSAIHSKICLAVKTRGLEICWKI